MLPPARLDKVDEIKETLLVVPHLRSPIDSLDVDIRRPVTKLPVVRKRPGIRPRDIHAVLPNGLEHLGQVAEVVVAPRRVEQLVRERDLVRLGKDGEAKLGDGNGPAPRAPDESSAVAVELSRGSHLPHVV